MTAKTTKIEQIILPAQIEYVSLTRTHVALWYQFHYSARMVIDVILCRMLNIEAFYDIYTERFKKADTAFKVAQAYEETKTINQLDRNRDNLFMSLFDTVRLNLRMPDANLRSAAEHLMYVISPYAKSHRAPLDEETALLYNLYQDLNKDENRSKITQLNLKPLIDQLHMANSDFDDIYTNRIDAKVARKAIDNLVTLRPQVDEVYRAIVQTFNSNHITNEYAVTPDEAIRQMLLVAINRINGLIIQLNENMANLNKKSSE